MTTDIQPAEARRKAAEIARAQAAAITDRVAALINQGVDVVKISRPLDELSVWRDAIQALTEEDGHV
jgi:hypothetical protein